MCLLKIRCLLLIICKCLVITTSYAAVKRSVPQSPCPSVLEYEFDKNNKLLGYIASAPPTSFSNVITLDVQYTVGNEVQDDAKLELMSSRSTIAEDVGKNKLLLYKLEFPRWQNIPPQITKISMNENQICYGQPLDIPGIRTVKLQHRQSLTVLPLSIIRPDYEGSVQSVGYGGPSKTKPQPANPWIYNPQAPTDPRIEVNTQKPQSTFSFFPNEGTAMSYPLNPQAPSDTNPIFNKNNDPTLYYPRPIDDDLEIYQLSTSTQSNPIRNPFWKVCGKSTVQLIIHGNKVTEGEHPWVAALFIQDDKGIKFICGSTLISDRHVVTAAHCVTNTNTKVEDFNVVLGKKNINNWSHGVGQIVEAESTHPHPEYKQGTGHADIAVIRLRDKVIFTNLIQPICLWAGDPNHKFILQKKGTVVGWGKDETGKQYTAEPKQLTIPVAAEEDCLRSDIHFKDITSDLTFCAGYRNNSGPCTGDSGSGFFMKQNRRWTLRGVVSTALEDDDGSCDVKEYIVFADAAVVTEWLLTFIN